VNSARCYIAATGVAFALIFVVHVARIFAEGTAILREPIFTVASILSLGLAIWAAVLLRRPRPD
jgi:hypothetical protein